MCMTHRYVPYVRMEHHPIGVLEMTEIKSEGKDRGERGRGGEGGVDRVVPLVPPLAKPARIKKTTFKIRPQPEVM